MNTLKLQCNCGQIYLADPERIGSSILCQRCGNLVPVERHSALVYLRSRLMRQHQGRPYKANKLKLGCDRSHGGLVPLLSCAIAVGIYGCIVTGHPQPIDVTQSNPLKVSHHTVAQNLVEALRPRNGYNLVHVRQKNTLSDLTIINGLEEDALVKLIPVVDNKTIGKAERYVYVRANNQVVLSHFAAKSYTLMFRTGSEWNGTNGFNENQADSKFGENLDFRDIDPTFDSQTLHSHFYHKYKVTLNPVFDGNVQTEHCDPDEFNNVK